MKIIPAIDIIGAKTVRLEKGNYDRKLSYDMAPVDAALTWESAGAEMLHVIDLDGAREGRPVNFSVVEEIIKAVNIPVETGGGYRKEIDIKRALDMGVWRVIAGSKAFEEVDFARNIIKDFGERVILSVDVDHGKLCIHGWEKSLDLDVESMINKLVSFGVKEIIYTDVSKDGTLAGPDISVIEKIMSTVSVNFVYAGGVKNIEHIRQLKGLEPVGLTGVITGRALYDGTIKLEEAISAGKENNTLP